MNQRPRTAKRVSGREPIGPGGSELSRHLLHAQEQERARISRELHDEIGQALMVLRFQLDMLANDSGSEELRGKVHEAIDLLDRTIEGLRRTIARLSPRLLEEFGLIPAVRRQAQLLAQHTGITPHLDLPEHIEPMDHDVEVALYRSVQEAVLNLAKHSHATNFTVSLKLLRDAVSLRIEDDGLGFSPRAALGRGFGLSGMRERAAALGGTVKISSQKNAGTQIEVLLPLNLQTAPVQGETARALRQVS